MLIVLQSTNTVMAGMFSLLNNTRGETNQGVTGNGWDDNVQNRATPLNRTPVLARRSGEGGILRTGFNGRNPIKMNMGKDRLPKKLRRRRVACLHPILRRSVCTIIMAGVILFTGLIFFLVDLLIFENSNSLRALIAMVVGTLLAVVGLVWYYRSKKKLRKLKNKIAKLREKKQQKKLENVVTNKHPNIMTLMLQSRRGTEWPNAPLDRPMQAEEPKCVQTLPIITHEPASDTESLTSLFHNEAHNSNHFSRKLQLIIPNDNTNGSRDSAYSELSCFDEGTSSRKPFEKARSSSVT